jgi:hypothetical protein
MDKSDMNQAAGNGWDLFIDGLTFGEGPRWHDAALSGLALVSDHSTAETSGAILQTRVDVPKFGF